MTQALLFADLHLSSRALRRPPRWLWSLALFASALLGDPHLHAGWASTLTPQHPVWRQPGIDHPALSAFVLRQRSAYLKEPPGRMVGDATKRARRAGKRSMKVLVIPVLFADTAQAPRSRDDLRRRFFADETEESFRGYWDYVSAGTFRPQGRVLPWLRVPGTLRDYANVVNGKPTNDGGVRRLVQEALEVAAVVADDLRSFDDDGPDALPGSGDDDGRIDFLLVLHPSAGFENDPADADLAILAHQGRLPDWGDVSPELQEQGVLADAYVVASATGPLGVWVHEFGHLLGLEDMYDLAVTGPPTEQPFRGGLGDWSLMANGTWGDGGASPSHLDALSRQRLGWDHVHRIDTDFSVDLSPVEPARSESLEIFPLGPWGVERFVLEARRRREGAVVDAALPGSGVLIYRVDDRLRWNRDGQDYWVTLLQADGREDLERLLNNGDAGDPFSGNAGSDLLGPQTQPSSESRTASPDRRAPVVEISRSDAQGSQRVSVRLADGSALRLSEAVIEDPQRGDRAHLLPLETAVWRLRWRSVGTVEPTSVQLRLTTTSNVLGIEPTEPVPLTRSGAWWVPASPIQLEHLGPPSSPEVPIVAIDLLVDGRARSLELGVPIGIAGGFSAESFYDFEPLVLAADGDTTYFARLALSDLPLPTIAGWATHVGTAESYSDGAELTLSGPWFAVPDARSVQLWSRHETESSIPGRAFDGGLIELFFPDRGWRALVPEGRSVVEFVQSSAADVRGRMGFGGERSEWSTYEIELPPLPSATRLRLRFASDGSNPRDLGGGWAIAGLQTGSTPARAQIHVQLDREGRTVAEADIGGDLQRIRFLRYRWRRPLDRALRGEADFAQHWQTASGLINFRPDDSPLSTILQLPEDERLMEIGLFAEVADLVTPPLLLGSAGFRRERTATAPRVTANPAQGTVVFQIEPRSEPQELLIHDVRGRRIRRLEIPAEVGWVEWGGTDDRGARVAAGRYIVSRADDGASHAGFVFFP